MEMKYRGGLRTRVLFGLVRNLDTILTRVGAIRLNVFHDGIAAGMFVGQYAPYQASETYRKIKVEFECKHSKALVEARALTFRGQ